MWEMSSILRFLHAENCHWWKKDLTDGWKSEREMYKPKRMAERSKSHVIWMNIFFPLFFSHQLELFIREGILKSQMLSKNFPKSDGKWILYAKKKKILSQWVPKKLEKWKQSISFSASKVQKQFFKNVL